VYKFDRTQQATIAAALMATPIEVAAHPDLWRQIFRTPDAPRRSEVKRFFRTQFAPGAALYSNEPAAPTLVVGFCGKAFRLGMPLPVVLQSLDPSRFDLLRLADSRRLYFDQGIPGFASSFMDLTDKIRALAARRKYEAIITYGFCMGGFPALRMGDLLSARRAISVAGRAVWHPTRLTSGQAVSAFDSICDCRMPSKTPSYVVFSSGKPLGAMEAKRIEAILRTCHLIGMLTDIGNFPFEIYMRGHLDAYHGELFNLHRDPDPMRLAGMLEPETEQARNA
jgi:hypothetical protein